MIKKLMCLLILSVSLLCLTTAAFAQISGVDDKESFDIYFHSSDRETSTIRNIRIVGIQEIAGKTFFIIRSYGFKLNDSIGYIAVDSVAAILPNQDTRVETNKNINVRY